MDNKWNWKTLAFAVAAVAVIITVFFVAKNSISGQGGDVGGGDAGNSPEVSITPTPEPTTPENGATVPREEYPSVKEQDKWQPASLDFAKTVVPAEGGQNAWLEKIQPFVSTKLAESLKTVDVNAVPTGSLDGVPKVVEYGQNYVTMEASYNTSGGALKIRYRMVQQGTEWKVDTYQPVRG